MVRCREADLDPGVVGGEVAESWHEPLHGKRRRDAEGQPAPTLVIFNGMKRASDLGQGASHGDHQDVALLREGDLAWASDKELVAEVVFETAHLMADGRLGDGQLFPRSAEAAVPGGRLETPKSEEGRELAVL